MDVDLSVDDNSNMTDSERSTYFTDMPIANNVKFNNMPLEKERKEPKKKKRQYNEIELENKHKEECNKEIREQRYKQLMHLLKASKFYSSFLINKLEKAKKVKKKDKPSVNNENVPPSNERIKKANLEKYNIQEYISPEIRNEMQAKWKRTNLNEEDIEAELSADSDTETKPSTMQQTAILPKYFTGDLYDYQQTGLEWLKVLYENALNGILADEMGLGKTIQVIALICHLIEKKQEGPYLIMAPLSTIPNWLMEFDRFAPDIPVVLFYGTQAERDAIRQKIKDKHHVTDGYKTQPVVITTYEVPLKEIRFLHSQKWRYIIIDEGQRIKNYNCMLVKALKRMNSMNRLILTGTPLQNNLAELWSLLNFLLPEIFDDLAVFESWFNVQEFQQEGVEKILKQEEEKQVLLSLREILKPFMLRRIKADVHLKIPPKKELVVYAPLTQLQHDLYKAVINHDLEILSKIEKPNLIIQTPDGKKAKRKAFLRSKYGSDDNSFEAEMSPSTSLQEIENSNDTDKWKAVKLADENNLSSWKQYTDVTERNRDFLIQIKFGRRLLMFKKIVNHPYLIHCPLDSCGLPKIDNDLITSSGKLLVLDAMLAKLKARGHKVLLFSTMTLILDMIEDYLSLRNYKYVRLDGQTKIEERRENIKTFNNDPDIFLFLISTRAGGVGLNLTGADTVIIYDSDWNPQVDIQAMARCHRIGQTKAVVIYRLCTKGTIDETIIKRSEAKRILEKVVISKEWQSTIINKDSLLQLKELMESKEYKVVTSENEVFTELELNKLLDRSDMINEDLHNIQE
ncbi:lymphoid-specific helicase [Anoplolepis gracilipes]|uniref:lymphoid-specific helicase n=1 Tax=Anoplolepis gracilipes TaxID=354296 RepID=UPI003B9EDEFB